MNRQPKAGPGRQKPSLGERLVGGFRAGLIQQGVGLDRGEFIGGYTEDADEFTTDPARAVYQLWTRDWSGWCVNDHHDHCAHRFGGPQQDGVTYEATPERPAHTWHCGCHCHTTPETLGRLF